MPAFSDHHIQAAIGRLPRQSSKDIRVLRGRAETEGLTSLIDACDAELAKRPIEYTGEAAIRFELMADQVRYMDLIAAIRHALTLAHLPEPDEIRCLRWIAANPGGTYQAASEAFGNGGLSLYIGHLVYNRLGCFLKFMQPGEDQSSVLLLKDRSGKSVRYTLRPETEGVFREMGILS